MTFHRPGHGGEAGLQGGDGYAKQAVVMLFSIFTCQTVAYSVTQVVGVRKFVRNEIWAVP